MSAVAYGTTQISFTRFYGVVRFVHPPKKKDPKRDDDATQIVEVVTVSSPLEALPHSSTNSDLKLHDCYNTPRRTALVQIDGELVRPAATNS